MILDDMQKICDKASLAPWYINTCHGGERHGCGPDIPYDNDELFVDQCYADGEFISASREFVPWAIERIRELEAVEKLEKD